MLKYLKNVNKFGLVAILLAGTTAFAFKAPEKTHKAKFATSWFSYNGSGDPTDAANYTAIPGTPTCPSGTAKVCGVFATNDGGSPDITDDLASEINTDLSGHTNSTNVKLRSN